VQILTFQQTTAWTGPFRLFHLPAELQLFVFDHAVTAPRPVELHGQCLCLDEGFPTRVSVCCVHQEGKNVLGTQPALARVCWSIRYDVLASFYKQNTFLIQDSRELILFDDAPMELQRWRPSVRSEFKPMIRVLLQESNRMDMLKEGWPSRFLRDTGLSPVKELEVIGTRNPEVWEVLKFAPQAARLRDGAR
jgi:hypothetical protein